MNLRAMVPFTVDFYFPNASVSPSSHTRRTEPSGRSCSVSFSSAGMWAAPEACTTKTFVRCDASHVASLQFTFRPSVFCRVHIRR